MPWSARDDSDTSLNLHILHQLVAQWTGTRRYMFQIHSPTQKLILLQKVSK